MRVPSPGATTLWLLVPGRRPLAQRGWIADRHRRHEGGPMSVLSRSALEASPLADLHAIASELGIDGFRRLRKAELVDRIVAHQGGDDEESAAAETVDEPAAEPEARPRRRRGGRGRSRAAEAEEEEREDEDAEAADAEGEGEGEGEKAEGEADVESDLVKVEDEDADEEERPARRTRGGRGRGGREREGRAAREGRDGDADADGDGEAERVVEGVVELLTNGSGFVRLTPPEPSDDDVYISAAQVRRCELVSGDRVGGPVRRPRRSERYPSLVRVETINGKPAEEVV